MTLEELLHSIENVELEIQRDIDIARDSFQIPSGAAQSYDGFRNSMACYFRHAENIVLRLRNPLPVDPVFDFQRCCQMLKRAYGSNGEITACQIAMSGAEGGIYQVLNNVGAQMLEEYAGNEISARVAAYWNSLSVDEKCQAGRDYLNSYSHLLPEDVVEGGAPRVRAYLPRFLEQHPRQLRRFRRVSW